MSTTLRPGSTWSVELSQLPTGHYVLANVLRVGRRETKRTVVGTYLTEEEMWVGRRDQADERIARIGLEKTKR